MEIIPCLVHRTSLTYVWQWHLTQNCFIKTTRVLYILPEEARNTYSNKIVYTTRGYFSNVSRCEHDPDAVSDKLVDKLGGPWLQWIATHACIAARRQSGNLHSTHTYPDSNLEWPNVGPTSVLSSRRWANVTPTYIAVWVLTPTSAIPNEITEHLFIVLS